MEPDTPETEEVEEVEEVEEAVAGEDVTVTAGTATAAGTGNEVGK